MAAISCVCDGPSKARRPVNISYSTAPQAKMSVRASIVCACSCSGAMYCTVPIPTPGVVNSDTAALPAVAPIVLARPKSSSFAPDLSA